MPRKHQLNESARLHAECLKAHARCSALSIRSIFGTGYAVEHEAAMSALEAARSAWRRSLES